MVLSSGTLFRGWRRADCARGRGLRAVDLSSSFDTRSPWEIFNPLSAHANVTASVALPNSFFPTPCPTAHVGPLLPSVLSRTDIHILATADIHAIVSGRCFSRGKEARGRHTSRDDAGTKRLNTSLMNVGYMLSSYDCSSSSSRANSTSGTEQRNEGILRVLLRWSFMPAIILRLEIISLANSQANLSCSAGLP